MAEQKKSLVPIFQVESKNRLHDRAHKIPRLIATRPHTIILTAIPLNPYNLARALALDIHDEEQLSDLAPRQAAVEVHFELTHRVWAFTV